MKGTRGLTRLTLVMAWGILSALHFAEAQPSESLSASTLEQTFTQLIEQVEPSVVSLALVRRVVREGPLLGNLQGQDERFVRDLLPQQFGSGFIVAADNEERLIVTCYHVVRGAPIWGRPQMDQLIDLRVWLHGQREGRALIYAADPRCDLAVLKPDDRTERLIVSHCRPLPWGQSTPIVKGQLALIMGNPYWIARDGSASASWGMVSNVIRRPAVLFGQSNPSANLITIGTAIHVEARLPLGTSGAPVFNLRGEVMGIASSLSAVEGYERSGGFAFPLEKHTHWILETLLRGHEVEYGFLGLRPEQIALREELQERYGQFHAVEVRDLRRGSPAWLAGVRDRDLILAINGQPVRSEIDLMRLATLQPPETLINLQLLRDNQELTVKVRLGKWPVPDEEGIIASKPRFAPWRGIVVDYPTARERYFRVLSTEIPQAVLITEILPDTPAQAALLQAGDYITHVNGKSVQTPAEFYELVKTMKNTPVALRLRSLDRRGEDVGRQVTVRP